MKIGLAQINPTVGDFPGNEAKIIEAYQALCKKGAELILFPELALCGYSPSDFLFKHSFIDAAEASIKRIAIQIGKVPAIIGSIQHSLDKNGLYNALAWCENGIIKTWSHKCLLPTYDVFDEKRYFIAGESPSIVEFSGKRIGLTICEDIWTGEYAYKAEDLPIDPVEFLAKEKVDIILNASASPWYNGKEKVRHGLVTACARRTNAPVIYCNMIGGNDQLVFDGRSIAVNKEGQLMALLPAFEEALQIINTEEESDHPLKLPETHEMAEIFKALVLGLKDYSSKCGFKKAVIGLSGGIDSAVVAVLAAAALGKENVIGVSLPSAISSDHSKEDARLLAENLDIQFHTIPIAEIVQQTEAATEVVFKGMMPDVTEENIQARARGIVLMALSNKLNALLLSTGNKSELAVGYCTLYGDMAGGLALISDLPKIKVYELAKYINREEEIIPNNTILKAPSAELRPDQKDQDSLPEYPVLDEILRLYIEERKGVHAIVEETKFDLKLVIEIIRKVDNAEYKRKQAPPGIKISPLAFGVGRRLPIAHRFLK